MGRRVKRLSKEEPFVGGKLTYHFMFFDDPIIDITVDEMHKVLEYKKFVPDCGKQCFWGDNITRQRLYDYLKSRCYEDGRVGLDEILASAGLESNNPYEWCRISHGVTYEDCWWIRYDDDPADLRWEDLKVR